MRRKAAMLIMIFACVILQSTVCEMIAIGQIKPNLLIILTVSFGLMRGRRDGLVTGFLCGLTSDLFFESIVGFHALLYMWVGYYSGYFYRIFYDDDIKTPLFLISVCDLVYGILQYGFLFLMRGRIHFFYYLGRIILPEVVYTLLLTIVCYRILYRINERLSLTDKRSVDSIV